MIGIPRSDLKRILNATRYVERRMQNPDTQRGRWQNVPPSLVPFELTENLALGGNATAYRLKWNGTAYVTDTRTTIEVYDTLSLFRQSSPPTGETGARGWAQFTAGRWEIIRMQHQALWIEFTVNDAGGFATTDSSVTVDGVVYHNGYEPTTAITTVYNTDASTNYKFEGDNNDKGEALYSIDEDKYYIIQMECP